MKKNWLTGRVTGFDPIPRLAHIFALALALFIAPGAWAVNKPLAVWNGDFPTTGNTDERGGFTLALNGNTSDGSLITIASGSSGGVRVMQTTDGSPAYKKIVVVAGIDSTDVSSLSSVTLFSMRNSNNDNKTSVSLNSSGGIVSYWDGSTSTSYPTDGSYETYPSTPALIYAAELFAADSGTYGYTNGIQVLEATACKNAGYNVYGMTIGWWYNTANSMKMTDAKINYIAVFADSGSTKANEDVTALAAFSPTDMTTSQTVADTGTISSDSAAGVNLNGGTVTVSDATTIAALFVQADTTLTFADSSAVLTITGPLYIADKVTLTVEVGGTYSSGTAHGGDLITAGAYAVENSTIEVTTPEISGGRITTSVSGPISWAYTPMPVWSNGAWSRTPTESDTEIMIDCSYNATYSAGGSYTTVYVTGNGTLPVENTLTATTLNVASGATVNMANVSATKITGSGTIVYDGVLPSYTFENKPFDTSWTGTVWVKNCTGNNQLRPNAWGNGTSSVVRFTGVEGWLGRGGTYDPTFELVDDGDTVALTLDYQSAETSADNVTITEIRGTGTLKSISSSGAFQTTNFKVLKWSDFTGSLNIDRGRFVFGTDSFNNDYRTICVSANQSVEVANGKTWYAYAGYNVGAGATLKVSGNISYGAADDGNVTDAVTGSGTVVFDGKTPSPTGNKWWTTSGWTGTVQIKELTGVVGTTEYTGTFLDFNAYGNTSSEVEIYNIKGWLASYTCTVPLKISGIFNYNNGLSGAEYAFKVGTLRGSGTISGNTGGSTQPFQVTDDWSEFTGAVQLSNSTKVIVFGDTMPDTIEAGGIYINSGKEVEIKSSSNWYAVGKGFVVDGTLKAADRNKWGGETAMLINSTGVLELGGTAGNDMKATSLANITGTGKIRFIGTGWQSLPTSANMFADTLAVENNCSGGLAVVYEATIGTLSGTGNFRCDFDSTNGSDRQLTIKQAANSTWNGCPRTSGTHLTGFVVMAANGATDKTLTYSGTQMTETLTLDVESSGSVNLTGTWNGATTVSGEFGGTGTLTGNLTFSEGATFKAFDSDENGLSVSGTVSCSASGTVTVDVDALDSPESDVVLISNTELDGVKFALKAGSPAGYTLAVEDNKLKLKTPAPVSITVPVVANTTVTVTAGGKPVEGLNGVYTVPYGSTVVVTYAAAEGYSISGTSEYTIASATADETIDASDTIVAQSQAAVVDTEGTAHYYPTAQAAVDAVDSYKGMGDEEKAYSYFAVFFGTDVAITVDLSKISWATLSKSIKFKCSTGVTISVAPSSVEYELNAGEPDEDGIVTYAKTPKATAYFWAGTGSTAQAWGKPTLWKVGSAEGDAATRAPSTLDTVAINGGVPISGAGGVTVAAIQVSGTAVVSGSGTLTATTGGIVLTDAAASIKVTGVTLSPTPTTTVPRHRVKTVTSGDTTTYSVEAIPGTTFTVY